MADTDMTTDEREAFLADLHVGILSIARDDKGPLALPIWYWYEDGGVQKYNEKELIAAPAVGGQTHQMLI